MVLFRDPIISIFSDIQGSHEHSVSKELFLFQYPVLFWDPMSKLFPDPFLFSDPSEHSTVSNLK